MTFEWILEIYAKAEKNVSLSLFVKVRDEVQNVFVKKFLIKNWTLSSVEDQCTGSKNTDTCKKNLSVCNAFKDDTCKLAQLKWQKMTEDDNDN